VAREYFLLVFTLGLSAELLRLSRSTKATMGILVSETHVVVRFRQYALKKAYDLEYSFALANLEGE
jgi:hypothetical protein